MVVALAVHAMAIPSSAPRASIARTTFLQERAVRRTGIARSGERGDQMQPPIGRPPRTLVLIFMSSSYLYLVDDVAVCECPLLSARSTAGVTRCVRRLRRALVGDGDRARGARDGDPELGAQRVEQVRKPLVAMAEHEVDAKVAGLERAGRARPIEQRVDRVLDPRGRRAD